MRKTLLLQFALVISAVYAKAQGEIPSLQQVTTAGSSTTNTITIGDLSLPSYKGLVIGNNAQNGEVTIGQTVDNRVSFGWIYNATPSAGYGIIATPEGNNPLVLQPFGNGKVGVGVTNPGVRLTLPNNEYIGWKNPANTVEDVAIRTNPQNDLTIYALGPDRIYLQSLTGNVGIGTNNPKARLTVNGDILATKLKITQSVWPDYVFSKEYVLPTLQELENYISQHKHLPGVPSAGDVETNDLDVGEMNKVLMEKVEELTLYLLQEHKRSNDAIEKNKELEAKIAALTKRLEILEQK